MADLLSTLRTQALLTDGAMGSLLFKRTGRLSETNHVYEAFNVDQPELIRRVHLDYLAAGARCVKTNTFGANRWQLRPFGIEARVAEINRAGVRRAREAIAEHQERHREAGPFFVLASIGPTAEPLANAMEAAECYHEQIAALVEAGADALLLETFSSPAQLELVLARVRMWPQPPLVIAQVTLRGGVSGTGLDPEPVAWVRRMAELGVAIAGVNCCAPWDASAFVDAVKDEPVVRQGTLLLAVMPNAGGFQRIGSRLMTTVNPEAAGKMARTLFERGVRLIGGCCEMHPPHIEEMRNYLQSRQTTAPATAVSRAETPARAPAGDEEKRGNGRFSLKLKAGGFVVSIEALPPRGTDGGVVERKVEFVAQLAASGLVDAVDFTDGSRGIPLVPPGDFIQLVRERLGWTAATGDALEMIPHFTGRDLNVMGVQGRLIGYHANRIHNVLFVTGDPPKMSPTYPRSTAVFDLDSVAMIRLTHRGLNAGVDFGGQPLGRHADPRTHFTIGSGFEPEARNLAREVERLQQKIEGGVDYIMTQPVFHAGPLGVLDAFRGQTRCLVGVMILTSYEHAQRMAQVPGVVVPDALLERFAALPQVADQTKLGQEIAAGQIRDLVREGWAGVYVMSTAVGAGVVDVLRAGLG
ncbi:homocysteine S-methyltransferase family protein [Horticoccus luteus]|uniref:Homocysteine S-methyltransferase family protein n=1 Tax=Horticoccus luteus TaxID=2862869 RepID=A0A8F9TWY4_9BACT|nr:homocysteine S-methyltransferase family protein [Horticoccus luteus]QYM80640.1 homocysteine S-methyltransferase family protein [Horticoccus luteus]